MLAPRADISLDALVLPKDEAGKERLCIAAPLPEEGGQSADMLLRPVTFGSLVLQQLYTVIDLKFNRLGFRQQARRERN